MISVVGTIWLRLLDLIDSANYDSNGYASQNQFVIRGSLRRVLHSYHMRNMLG